jgi:hypothetical protein
LQKRLTKRVVYATLNGACVGAEEAVSSVNARHLQLLPLVALFDVVGGNVDSSKALGDGIDALLGLAVAAYLPVFMQALHSHPESEN